MTFPPRRLLKADLHVHTHHSVLGSFPALGARDCYSEPRAAYRMAKARGMDLVTFTDHDTISGCLELLSVEPDLPDFFISEEVSTRDPRSGCRFHVSVYGIDEKQHQEIQRLRDNLPELLGYADQQGIPAALNHLGSSLVRRCPDRGTLMELLGRFRLLESRNGVQRRSSNEAVERVAELLAGRARSVGRTGGSDAHTLARIGTAWTEAEAIDRESYLASLRSQEVRPGGASSGLGPIVLDVYRIVLGYYRDLVQNRHGHFDARGRRKGTACALAISPLHLVALPVAVTLYRFLRVRRTARQLAREVALDLARARRREEWTLEDRVAPQLAEPGPTLEAAE